MSFIHFFKKSILNAAAFLGKWFYLAYWKTLSIETIRPEFAPQNISSEANQIYIFWHSKTFALLPYGRKHKFAILTLLDWKNLFYDALARFLGYTTVPLTSESRVTLRLINLIQDGFHAAIAVDGPKGPRGVMRPGALYLAAKTDRTVIPVAIKCERAFRFTKRWDHYEIPAPFSRVTLKFNPPIKIADKDLTEKQDEIIKNLGEF